MRIASGFAFAIVTTAACGDAQLDEWTSPSSLFVVPEGWSAIYAPGLDVVTAFPELANTTDPRFESSDDGVVEVRLFRQAIDAPRFWAARLRTTGTGDAEIRLWDGEVRVRTEPVRVTAPDALSFELGVPDVVPPFARSATVPLGLLALGRAPAVARIRDGAGSTMVAAGVVTSADGVTVENSAEGRLVLRDDVEGRFLARRPGQLDSGDRVVIGGGVTQATTTLVLPNVGSGPPELDGALRYESPDAITALDVLTAYDADVEGTWVVVFGRSDRGPQRRIMGLNPVVTVDGSGADVAPSDDAPWVAFIAAQQGTVEIRWRGLLYSKEI